MMKFITGLLLVLFTCVPSTAQDWMCKEAAGCTARKSVKGKLVTINFRKGDLLSSEDGWVIDKEDGWKRVNSGTNGGKRPPFTADQKRILSVYNRLNLQHRYYSSILPDMLHPNHCACWLVKSLKKR